MGLLVRGMLSEAGSIVALALSDVSRVLNESLGRQYAEDKVEPSALSAFLLFS